MKQSVLVVLVFTLLLGGLGMSQAGSGENSPTWFAWGQAWFHDDQTEDVSSSFLIKRARFGIKGRASDKWVYHFMVDGADSPRLMQAWVEYTWRPEFTLRVGQFKHGFGREALPPAIKWKFINPSRVVGKLGKIHVAGGTSFRDQGIMAHGVLSAGEMDVGYSVLLMNGNGINTRDVDGKKEIVGHLEVGLPAGFEAGGTLYAGEEGITGLGRSGFGVDIRFAADRLWIMGEYLSGTMEQDGDADDLNMSGFYAGATFRALNVLEIGGRFDSYDPDTDLDNDAVSRITLGISYYPAKLNRITLNYEIPSAEDDDVELDPVIMAQFQGSL